MTQLTFPDHFTWGAATSSYQIEGAPDADGKGESIWDRFTHTPGNIWNGENGDRACDHYHLYHDDVCLMADFGLQSYRFSISWPRVFPEGGGKPNRKGMDFYRRLVDRLNQHGIKPAVTLYHWDLPQALQEKGGWANRDTARYFEQYAAFIFENLDLPVDLWITLNEPWVSAFLGHALGVHAPGENDFSEALQVSHNLLLAHGFAVHSFRSIGRENEQIGIALNLAPVHPASDSDADKNQARRTDGFMNRWFLDPIFKGVYPRDMVEIFSRSFEMPVITEEDDAIISAPLDFLGVNNYTRTIIRAGSSEDDFMGSPENPPDAEYTEMGWEVYPQGIYELLIRLHNDYQPPKLYITENGAAFADEVNNAGEVRDLKRISYLQSYITEAWNALQDGVPLEGYYAWSLLDNFEWSFGYSKRFGLIYVDFPSLQRIPKRSAYWYRDLISRNGLEV
ncbi:MAG: GH1 family beta-glucosidase [Bacillota bacterium]